MLFGEGTRDYDSRTQRNGLLDRVPGWLILVVVGAVIAALVIFYRFE